MRDKFGWDDDRLDRFLPKFWKAGHLVIPRLRLRAVRDDPNDDRILECALAAGADAVVSGDRHLLTLNRYEGIVIVSPREFLRLIV